MSTDHTGITVIGLGEVEAPPDLITVDLAVSVRAETVAEASGTAADSAKDVLNTLSDQGVSETDLQTTRYSIHPEYDHRDGEQRLLGFRVSNDLRVRLRDTSSAGRLLDAVIAAGGDHITVSNISHSIEDNTDLLDRAREHAWANALAKGEHLARLAGRSLGPVLSIVETRDGGPAPMPRMAAMAEGTPIATGAATIRVTLEVRFALE